MTSTNARSVTGASKSSSDLNRMTLGCSCASKWTRRRITGQASPSMVSPSPASDQTWCPAHGGMTTLTFPAELTCLTSTRSGGRDPMNRRAGRSSPAVRRARRAWLLRVFGDGKRVPCFWCDKPLRKPQLDRWPVCGHRGGTYRRSNLVPACGDCNRNRCNECLSLEKKDREVSYVTSRMARVGHSTNQAANQPEEANVQEG